MSLYHYHCIRDGYVLANTTEEQRLKPPTNAEFDAVFEGAEDYNPWA